MKRRGARGSRGRVSAALAISAMVALAACSGGGGAPEDEDTITFMNWDAVEGSPMEEALATFTEQSGIQVNVQPTSAGSDYDARQRTSLASSESVDVMRMNDDYIPQFSETGSLLDLNPYIDRDLNPDDFPADAFNFGVQPDGSHTAWTVGYLPALVIYNKTMFEEAGVDLPPSDWTAEGWTWDDFLATAHELTTDDAYGALVAPDTNYEQTFIANNGGSGVFADGTSFTMADPEGVEAVQWVADLTCTEGVQPPWSLMQAGDNPAVRMFLEGQVAMLFTKTSAIPAIRSAGVDFEYALAPPPARDDQLTGSSVVTYVIPQNAPNPDKAWELLKFFASQEGGEILGAGQQFVPINTDAVAAVTSASDEPPENQDLLVEAAGRVSSLAPYPNFIRAYQIYRPALDAVYNCEASAADVLGGLRDEIESVLANG